MVEGIGNKFAITVFNVGGQFGVRVKWEAILCYFPSVNIDRVIASNSQLKRTPSLVEAQLGDMNNQ